MQTSRCAGKFQELAWDERVGVVTRRRWLIRYERLRARCRRGRSPLPLVASHGRSSSSESTACAQAVARTDDVPRVGAGVKLQGRPPSASPLDAKLRSRALAALFGAGGTITLVSLVFPHWDGLNAGGVAGPAVAAEFVGIGLFVGGHRLAARSFHFFLALGTICICVAVHFGGTAVHTLYATYFVWIALYGFHFFSRWAASAHLGLAGLGYLIILTSTPTAAAGPAWLVVMGTAAVSGLVVASLVAKVNRLAHEDPMTGIANRRSWDDALQREVGSAIRHHRPLSVAMMDLDGLKAINDEHGHRAGDDMIIAATTKWTTLLRGQDVLARLGGDEFGLLLPECSCEEAKMVLMRMNAALDGLTVSSGVASLSVGESAHALCIRADDALYRAKRAGRSRVVVAS